VTPANALGLLERIASGVQKVGTSYAWVHENMAPGERALLSPGQEAEAWRLYRRFAETVEPRAGFSGRMGGCVANGPEQRRRRALTGMFFLVEFRSQDAAVRELFERSVGRVSLKELIGFCGRRIPHFYYEWAFGVLPLSGKLFGPDALRHFAESPDHRRTFVKLDLEKRELLSVKAVMES